MSDPVVSLPHTPGPWVFWTDADGYRVGQSSKARDEALEMGDIAHVFEADGEDVEAFGNAHLIAGAPSLLIALEAAVAFLENLDPCVDECEISNLLASARAAIARAKGASGGL